jgi:alanyl-tRNA synthetase
MAKQRTEARAAWAGSGEAATDEVWFELRERLGATEFLGYDAEMAEGEITAILVEGSEVDSLTSGTSAAIVTNQTPFYGESGGQQGDAGVMFSKDGATFTISDTQKKLGNFHVHMGTLESASLKTGDIVELRVDHARRDRLRANHSATHLLHAALRDRLGDHVTQKGSLVAHDRLRFDVSHPKPMGQDEIRAVEANVNAEIRANTEVSTRIMTPDEAVEAGALALFGEKYGDEVRVVAMGADGSAGDHYSVELCGGTHVRRTGDIGTFRIVSEGALASGVRRIEALTGVDAEARMSANSALLAEAAGLFKSAPEDVPQRIATLLEDRRRLDKELSEVRRKLALGGGAEVTQAQDGQDIAGTRLVTRSFEDVPAKDLKPMVDDLKAQAPGVYVVISASEDGKASIVVGVTDDLTERFDAVALVRTGAEVLGGKGGGGRPDMAQAGGPDASAADAAFAAIANAMAAGDG